MKGMHFIVVEDGAMAGQGVVKQGVGEGKYLCEFPQMSGIRLSRIMLADNMVEWLFFNNQNSLNAYMQMQAQAAQQQAAGQTGQGKQEDPPEDPPTPDDPPADPPGDDGMDPELEPGSGTAALEEGSESAGESQEADPLHD